MAEWREILFRFVIVWVWYCTVTIVPCCVHRVMLFQVSLGGMKRGVLCGWGTVLHHAIGWYVIWALVCGVGGDL